MKIKAVRDSFLMPTRGTEHAAGFDVLMPEGGELKPGETRKVRLAFATAIPVGFAAYLMPRSSAGKAGLRLANTIGLIDADYRGEWMAVMQLDAQAECSLVWEAGDKLLQFVIGPVLTPDLELVDFLNETSRGEGGFGSTGK